MTPYDLGLAGAGWLGECLLKELPRFPELRLAAVQDANAELAEQVGRRYGSLWWGADYGDLLNLPGVDAVMICTPNFCHAPQALAALEAGKHVLVQKPLALTAAQARCVVDAADRTGKALVVDYSYRFLETIRWLEEALPRIGRVQSAAARFHNIYGPGKPWCFSRAQSGGGALIDLGVHLIDLALALLRPRRSELTRAQFHGHHEVESDARLELALDGVPLDIAVSWNAPMPQTEIGLIFEGERGRAAWQNVDGSFFCFRTLLNGDVLVERETALRDDTLRAFSAALRSGRAEPPDLRVYDVLDAAYAAVSGTESKAAAGSVPASR